MLTEDEGSNLLNATVRWTVACRRLDGGNTFLIIESLIRSVVYRPAFGVVFFLAEDEDGFERAAPVRRLVQKHAGGMFLARGRIHRSSTAVRRTVGDGLSVFLQTKCNRVACRRLDKWQHLFDNRIPVLSSIAQAIRSGFYDWQGVRVVRRPTPTYPEGAWLSLWGSCRAATEGVSPRRIEHPLSQKSEIFDSSPKGGAEGAVRCGRHGKRDSAQAAPSHFPFVFLNCPLWHRSGR